MPIQLLTASKIERELKKPGRYADGAGLYLQIANGGTRAWLFQYSWQGRIRQLGLPVSDRTFCREMGWNAAIAPSGAQSALAGIGKRAKIRSADGLKLLG
jgi:hypothetical protein